MMLQESMTGFYYIGANRENISKLVGIYKRGYASGDILQAIAELTRENHIIPEVICCESGIGFIAIKKMTDQLALNKELSTVPFMVVDDFMHTGDNHLFVRNKMIDDVISIKDCDEIKLAAKFRFIQKFKKRYDELTITHTEILAEENINPLKAMLKRCFDILVSLVNTPQALFQKANS